MSYSKKVHGKNLLTVIVKLQLFGNFKKLTKTFFKLDHTFDKRQFLKTGPEVKKFLGKALLTVIVKIQMFGSNIMSNIACGKFLKNQNTFCENSEIGTKFRFSCTFWIFDLSGISD